MPDLPSPAEAPDWRPDERALFQNRYARWGRTWMLVGAASLVIGIVPAARSGEIAGILVACIGGTLGLILGFAFWFTGRGTQRQLDGIRAGGHLARWTVDHDRWWAWQRSRQSALKRATLVIVVLPTLTGYLVAGLVYSDGDTGVAGAIAVVTTLLIPVIWLVIRAHRAPEPPPSMRTMPVIVGPHGALTVGMYLQWYGFGMTFRGAVVEAEPPTLAVSYDVQAKHSTVRHTVDLPVPAGQLDDAHRVAAQLNGGL